MTPDTPAASAPVHVLIPAAVQRRMAARIEALRSEITAFVAALPSDQDLHS